MKISRDIVYSLWKHKAVHKRTGEELAHLVEYKDNKFSIHSRTSVAVNRADLVEHIRQGRGKSESNDSKSVPKGSSRKARQGRPPDVEQYPR